jgi:hypothetical protein
VAIGSYWNSADPSVQIDVVALAGRERVAVLAGESKWARRVRGDRLRWDLERKVEALPSAGPDLRYAIAAREHVDAAEDVMAITAADIFA